MFGFVEVHGISGRMQTNLNAFKCYKNIDDG